MCQSLAFLFFKYHHSPVIIFLMNLLLHTFISLYTFLFLLRRLSFLHVRTWIISLYIQVKHYLLCNPANTILLWLSYHNTLKRLFVTNTPDSISWQYKDFTAKQNFPLCLTPCLQQARYWTKVCCIRQNWITSYKNTFRSKVQVILFSLIIST